MNAALTKLISFLRSYANNHPRCSKFELANVTASHFGLRQSRSVYHCPDFAIRFSVASGTSFSNVVLSLSALRKYDKKPFIVCVVRPKGVEPLMANTTFLKKISHSSHQLRVDNVRGSFLGHDIMREYEGIENIPENFDDLFEIHTQFTWDENLERLVERTNAIAPVGRPFEPSEVEIERILSAPKIAKRLSADREYLQIRDELSQTAKDNVKEILRAGHIHNVNLRGNEIERIMTRAGASHKLENTTKILTSGVRLMVDIKSKMFNLTSNPKGYNIDKVLKELGARYTVISFFFIGIDIDRGEIQTSLASIFDHTILKATRIQFHWAGRSSRGVTQLTSEFTSALKPEFSESIDVGKAQSFLKYLINLRENGSTGL